MGVDTKVANKMIHCHKYHHYVDENRADNAEPSFQSSGETQMPAPIVWPMRELLHRCTPNAVGALGTFHKDQFPLGLVFVPNTENILSSSTTAGSGFR